MTRLPLRAALAALLLAAAAAHAQPAGCRPVEQADANAASQRPAFPGQTRACAAPPSAPVAVDVLARGLDHPWAVEPLPDGRFLVTERVGRMRLIAADGRVGAPIEGLPKVQARGQGGLLDVALSPRFDTDRTVYWSYTEPRDGGNATSVARGVLAADGSQLDDVRVILRTQPTYDGSLHFGSRLAFGPDGMLYVTLGERSDRVTRPQAQQMTSHLGKILRIRPDGSVPSDNPSIGPVGAMQEIWTLGHRNVQAAAFDAAGRLWVAEMGAQGGDELNLIDKGRNYGWPVIAYGEEYGGRPIGEGLTARDGMEQPVYYWDPVIAPSAAQWYDGEAFPDWRGNLFVGALRGRALVRLVVEGTKVVGEERLLTDRGERIRDVRQGPDGWLYLLTDSSDGQIVRLERPPAN